MSLAGLCHEECLRAQTLLRLLWRLLRGFAWSGLRVGALVIVELLLAPDQGNAIPYADIGIDAFQVFLDLRATVVLDCLVWLPRVLVRVIFPLDFQ